MSGLTRDLDGLKVALSLQAVLLGVFDAREPEAEGVLAAAGADASRLRAWCAGVSTRDAAWRDARSRGVARACPADAASLLPGEHGMTAALPASLDGQRYWCLAVARDHAFTPEDEVVINLALRRLQLGIDHLDEPTMSRLFIGGHDRVIHADPDTQARLIREPELLPACLAVLRPAIAQRWGALTPGPWRHAVLPLPQGPTWVRFALSNALNDLPGVLDVELRPVEPMDPPAVGMLPDDRLAKSLAYLLDHFRESPSLDQIAEAAHLSPFHFHRVFNQAVGMSPKHYVLRMQLMVAKQQLRTTHRPIGAIAEEAGFKSHGHFTATFHRIVGMSPTAYREQGVNRS